MRRIKPSTTVRQLAMMNPEQHELKGALAEVRSEFWDHEKTYYNLDELVLQDELPAWYAKLLSWAVVARKNILIIGEVASGKTTLLNALLDEVDDNARLVIAENGMRQEVSCVASTYQMRCDPTQCSEDERRKALTRAAKLRPDYMIIDEIKTVSTLELVEMMCLRNGLMTTMIVRSSEQALDYMYMSMQQDGLSDDDEPTPDKFAEMVGYGLDYVVKTTNGANCCGAVVDMWEIIGASESRLSLRQVVRYEADRRVWALLNEPEYIDELTAMGALKQCEVEQWRVRCSREV